MNQPECDEADDLKVFTIRRLSTGIEMVAIVLSLDGEPVSWIGLPVEHAARLAKALAPALEAIDVRH